MKISEYFVGKKGHGVMATADAAGKVDIAVYATPHVMEDHTVAFIMRDRLTHHNLQSNPKAAYLFIEEGAGYKGVRLYLTKLREEQDSELLYTLRRKEYPADGEAQRGPLFLVFFKVEEVLPLIGAGNPPVEIN
ncbi:pyridoxamine 5'-phosphate oxidase family protein [Desulfoferrobacter suflitae]|uniref:pyridoxamine 5'-phosphate oxidase family protein n=1 Tax=Desulfoferrobacter suflitae TaxID=2865782 RepID=UPI0021645C6B|nr:pyridoxamine 5'-phosphate oxidase family protein [Desulfoferrobacter suflitae]MCK8602771.1 pyridoxamine 5'-phosphate oxidase family protein [Desulfoferrobacter suflitae]